VTSLARLIVRLSALLIPRHLRGRWREEWLGEIDAANTSWRTLTRALGAPKDALSCRSSSRGPLGPRMSVGLTARGYSEDIRDAFRSLRKTPIQSATIVGCLALGSALTVLMFGVINALVAGDLPGLHRRNTLARILTERPDGEHMGLTMGQFHALPMAIPGLSSYGGELTWRFSTRISDTSLVANGGFVSGSYFQTLGTAPAAGRLIQPSDDLPAASPVVVIGYRLWQTRMGGRSDAVGQTIHVGNATYEVIGVAPRHFTGLDVGDFGRDSAAERGDIWLPMAQIWNYPNYSATRVDDAIGPRLVGRLDAGLTREAAEARAQQVLPHLNERSRGSVSKALHLPPLNLMPGSKPGQNAIFISLLMSVPLVVMGIACANVAGVQLARAITRTHELAVRVSIGATRWRLVRLLVTETLMLSVCSGAVAWFVAAQALRLSAEILPLAPAADWRVLLFSISLPMAITMLAGLFPAWRATGFDVLSGLRLGARVGRTAGPFMRRSVLVTQVALSALLVVIAGALITGLRGMSVAIGAPLENVFVAEVRFTDLGLSPARAQQLAGEISEGAARLPGVSAAAISTLRPALASNATCWTDATKSSVSGWDVTLVKLVTPSYFEVIDLLPVAGRTFEAREDDAVVVNEAFLQDTRGPRASLGSTIRIRRGNAPSSLGRIVGVVPDAYERAPRGFPRPLCYLPFAPSDGAGQVTVYLRSSAAASLAAPMHALLNRVDSRLSPAAEGTIAELINTSHRAIYWIADAVAFVSVAALLLAAIGLFGTISHSTTQRVHEFGVRLALGARPGALAAQVVREALAVVAVGLLIGGALAVPVAGVLRTAFLSSITAADPRAAVATVLIFGAVAIAAAVLPARRTSAINPVSALRAD
jgi:putative ABC transport system permease protein